MIWENMRWGSPGTYINIAQEVGIWEYGGVQFMMNEVLGEGAIKAITARLDALC